MIFGAYTLDLYCENMETYEIHKHMWYVLKDGRKFPLQYVGQTNRECMQLARAAGWTFKTGEYGQKLAICPICSKKK